MFTTILFLIWTIVFAATVVALVRWVRTARRVARERAAISAQVRNLY